MAAPQRGSRKDHAIAITGWGMVSPLGPDVASSCAAARAGIRRARMLREVVLSSEDDGEDVLPIGHVADFVTAGFEGWARLLRLFHAAVADLVQRTWPQEGAPPADVVFYLSLPDSRRIYSELEEIADEASRQARKEAADEDTDRASAAELARRLLEMTASMAGWRRVPEIALVVTTGHSGVTELLAAAARDLAARPEGGTAVVGGVDSLVEEETLLWLNERRRLKHSDNPVGVEPGEAAAFLVLERPGLGRPAACVRARLGAAHVGVSSSEGPPGSALAGAIVTAHAASGQTDPPCWLLSDHDGTPERAEDVGNAVVRLAAKWPGSNPALFYPAVNFGDVGAATGAVSSCLAMAAWDRRWAPLPAAYVLTTDGTSRRAAHALLAPDGWT